MRIEAHHEPPVAKGNESSDSHVCPLCAYHHAWRTAHTVGEFLTEFGVDLRVAVMITLERRLSFLEGDEVLEEPSRPKKRKTTRKNRTPYESYKVPWQA